jgi:hypothetical protein
MKSKRYLMLTSLLVVLVINVLANTLPINGLTTGEISDRFSILFVPAGYVFSIWGIIYLALIGFGVYIFTPKGLANEKIDHIAWWFVAANLFNAAWILLWHYLQFSLTLIPILGLLVSLVMIYLKLGIGKIKRSWREILLVTAPFSIYLGWATVAVVANITQVLFNLGYRGAPLSEPLWAALLIMIATVLGLLMIFIRKEVLYPLVLTWAFIGIWVKQGDVPLVAITALVTAILLALLSLGYWALKLFKKA